MEGSLVIDVEFLGGEAGGDEAAAEVAAVYGGEAKE